MKLPKFALVSDGDHTMALIDGVVIGDGICRLDFSTSNEHGEMHSAIRVMELDIKRVKLSTDKEKFLKAIELCREE